MYSSHNLAIMIKQVAKAKDKVIKDMLDACGLGSNTMSALYHGKSMAFDSLAKIADYLGCSVDYLIGRTDIPDINTGNMIKTGDIQAGDNSNKNSSININGNLMPDFMTMFADLSVSDKIETMYFVKKLKDSAKK